MTRPGQNKIPQMPRVPYGNQILFAPIFCGLADKKIFWRNTRHNNAVLRTPWQQAHILFILGPFLQLSEEHCNFPLFPKHKWSCAILFCCCQWHCCHVIWCRVIAIYAVAIATSLWPPHHQHNLQLYYHQVTTMPFFILAICNLTSIVRTCKKLLSNSN